MTDKQIIKALECCHSELGNMCSICPLFDADNDYCEDELHKSTLDLISRQKAEIEELTAENERLIKEQSRALICVVAPLVEKTIKAAKKSVIKEFARELKCGVPQETGVIRCKDIDDLVKQMTEVKENVCIK